MGFRDSTFTDKKPECPGFPGHPMFVMYPDLF